MGESAVGEPDRAEQIGGGIAHDHRVLVSQHVHGGESVQQAVLRYAGAALGAP